MSLAVVGLAADGSADYGFHVLGAADWQWTDEELAARAARAAPAILHVGSISSWTAPGLRGHRAAGRAAAARRRPDQRRPQHPADAGRRAGRRDARQHRGDRARAAGPAASRRPTSSRSAPRTSPGSSPTPTAADLDAAARRLGRARPGAGRCSPTAAPRCGSPARAAPCCTGEPPRVTVADTVGAGDSLAAGLLGGLLGAGVTTRAALEALPDERPAARWSTTPRSWPPSTAPGWAPTRRPAAELAAARAAPVTRPATCGSSASRNCRATAACAARLLDAHDRFWRHRHPRRCTTRVWFHQFGGFGALARTADGEDVGYVLGVVSADRLAYLHLLAVRDDRRRSGLGRRLCRVVRRPGGGHRARAPSRRSPARTTPPALALPHARSARVPTCPATTPAGRGPRAC